MENMASRANEKGFSLKILFIYLTQRERSQVGREAGRERGAEQRAQCGA